MSNIFGARPGRPLAIRRLLGTPSFLPIYLPIRQRDLHLFSDIPDEDFGGFYAYARRIRWLRPSRDSPSIDVSVYTSLWSKIDGCLLPGLQIFDLSAAPDYPRVAPSSVLLSESLHTVDISAYRRMSPGTIKNLEYYFSCMVTESPSVQKLRVSAHFASACLSHLSGLHNLQVLEFQKELIYSAQGQGDATKEAMLALSGLRSLVTLRMDVQGETFEMETLAMHDLPCLEVVELNGILDPMVSILRHLPKHRIHSLRFDVLCRAESDPIQNVAVDHHCLFKQLAFPQLRILKFYSEVGGGDDELPVQTGELLSEALRCRHLETLDVNFVCAQVATDDEDIRNMALAWPKIQRVKYVQCEETMHPAGLPTIFALEHFAQHCPDLTILDVILNADVDYYPADITPYTHGLKRLLLNEIEVWLLRHECWRHLARYLDSLFPNLEILDEDDTGDNWAQMFQNIDILQQATLTIGYTYGCFASAEVKLISAEHLAAPLPEETEFRCFFDDSPSRGLESSDLRKRRSALRNAATDFAGEVSDSLWTILDNYARRIRWLDCELCPDVSDDVWQYLWWHRGPSLLPRLQSLQLNHGGLWHLDHLSLLIGPSLIFADISTFHRGSAAETRMAVHYLGRIAAYSRGLRHLFASTYLSAACFKGITMLPNLRSLELQERYRPYHHKHVGLPSSLAKETLGAVSGMRGLRYLRFHLSGRDLLTEGLAFWELVNLSSIELWGDLLPVASVL
ncbi:hypothetical protein GLOTRDRAFT_91939 [Gloeophyllum trabeum ATCC 11539]|uniref:RNI-like protein n=1 Tax=Gloeophyllum trabeum (strain ATCC 11539 / FP-39264 / Madison 617) TaxID=670483 RepID=S7QH49_GLOTA|nr:uncharacterized protein GLOTRDRAFT_91939 [Gloeophyllum trabeum ATCC 11539]EPQ58563.1 hypothetical protein GLOTRDRAFT_91939 [Gloeophyllum trabeum ATCC 11539]